MLKMVAISCVDKMRIIAIEVGFLRISFGRKIFLLTQESMIHAVSVQRVADKRRINLGNSKSSELIVVKVRGMKMMER